MKDILNMTLLDFQSVVDEMIYENTPRDKRYGHQTESQKEMIKRLKEIKKVK